MSDLVNMRRLAFACTVMLCGCQQSGGDFAQLAEARRAEVVRLNHIDALSDNLIAFSCERESLCDTGTLVLLESGDYSQHFSGTREELVCTLNQAEF